MKHFKTLGVVFITLTLLTSCFEDRDDNVIATSSINDFVWKGMNSWYNWQSQVPNLADSKDDNSTEYTSYLSQYTNPEDLFNSLIFQPNVVDRFSWFIEDYIVQEQEFQGISLTFGMRYQAVQINTAGDIIVYVRYVADNSPASNANIKRGDIIYALDGIELNTSNFNEASSSLYNETTTFSFATVSNGMLTPSQDKTITAAVVSENPVHLTKVFNDVDGKKVGYLVFTRFSNSYNDELNEAFATFKNENIDELILDLRLNGGGSVGTSAYLSSMIYANAGEDTFANLEFNSKHSNENGSYNFTNTLNVFNAEGTKTGEQTINRLTTLNRLYVLVSESTASASEMVINGLKPFIPVKLIGTTTYGKNVGSITLYDSPRSDYTSMASANPAHSNAMQPIVFQIFNKNGESDYTQGFTPDIEVVEYEYWNNTLPFGDENEIVLKTALDDIKGVTSKHVIRKSLNNYFSLKLKSPKKFETEMYLDHDFSFN